MSGFPNIDDVFAGKYRVETVLSQSNTTRLFAAREVGSKRRVALKVVLPDVAANPGELARRINREAKVLEAVQTTSSIALYEHGQSGDAVFLAFEFVQGPSLAQVLATNGPLSVARTVTIACQLLRVLGELHGKGIIHRDLKPSNIMFENPDGTGAAKLADFAIAKAWTHTSAGEPLLGDLTGKGRMMGTPRYMSPEQVVGRHIAPQSDLYSLGLVMLEMLTGQHANPGDDAVVVIHRHLSDEPFPIPPGLPRELDAALRAMLSKPIEDRPEAAAVVLAQLTPLRATFEGTPDDATIPLPGGIVAIAQQEGTDPNVPILPVASEEPTLPTDKVASIVDAVVATDETVKFDNAIPEVPAEQSPPKGAPPGGAFWPEPEDAIGRIETIREGDSLTLVFPAKMELTHIVLMGLAAIATFVVSILTTPFVAPLGLGVVLVIFLTTRVSRRFELRPQGWALHMRLGPFKREITGALASIHALGASEKGLEMVTDEGTITLVSEFKIEEFVAAAQLANEWIRGR